MMQNIINNLYSDYFSGELSRSEFEGLLYNYFFENQDKTSLSHWKRDEYEDYISWFYPKLHKVIDSYRDTGASFEAFITRFILVSSREYRVRLTSKAVTEYSVWCATVPDMYQAGQYHGQHVHEEPPVYIHKNIEKTITNLTIDKKGRRNTRRLLALIIKCYYYVSEDFAEKIAPKLGVEKKILLDMLKKIRIVRQKRDDSIYMMRERVNSQFLRCLVYERKLALLQENAAAHKKMLLRLNGARERLEKMRKRVMSMRTDATNKQVAQIIGIAKGTVDSSLHKLKSKWEIMSKNAYLN